MSASTTRATLDPTPNPDAAFALGAFFGALRNELIEQGFPLDRADDLVVSNSKYVFENSGITITREVHA